jgi:hypothetical protein
MRTLLLVLLVCVAIGCGKSTMHEDSASNEQRVGRVVADTDDKKLTVIEVPRPNSGTYTTERATELLPSTLKRSTGVSNDDEIYTKWKNPTHGFRVFVNDDGTIETIDVLNETRPGIDGLKSALELSRSMQFGNPLSVLLASESGGWTEPYKSEIVYMLFQPSIQLYLIGK